VRHEGRVSSNTWQTGFFVWFHLHAIFLSLTSIPPRVCIWNYKCGWTESNDAAETTYCDACERTCSDVFIPLPPILFNYTLTFILARIYLGNI
jgi:hypothetical protein